MDDQPSTDRSVSEEQVSSFSWWLCMLPFAVAIAVFVYKWWLDKSNGSWLMYAGGALLIGLVFTAMVNNVAADGTAGGGNTEGGGTKTG